MTVVILVAYLALVATIGLASHRLFRGTGEDFFLATRSIGGFVLLMSLFGTHMTAFSLLGASGEGYRRGIGVFGLMASSSALVVPAVFLFLAPRVSEIGRRLGVLTQVQFFRARWGSELLGTGIFVALVGLLVPYLLIGVMGAGVAVEQITGGTVAGWLGSATVCVVVWCYVTFGGMRGTAWVNTFQTLVFMILGGVTFFWITSRLGGLEQALNRVAEISPEHLIRGDEVKPLKMWTYAGIPLSAGMFPHLFMHWLTAKRASSFRLTVICYPLCVAAVWLPSVLLGVIGTAAIPGLAGPAANSILVKMIEAHAPEILAGLLGAGVFAAIMSSLDSQVLALGTMFTHDIVRRLPAGAALPEGRQVAVGRWFVATILAVTFVLSLVARPSIFKLGVWSFTGFASLVPIVVAAVYWKRSTKYGALAALLGTVTLWCYFFVTGWGVPGYTVGGTGLMPVAVIVAVSSVLMVTVSLVTNPPERERIERFFGETVS